MTPADACRTLDRYAREAERLMDRYGHSDPMVKVAALRYHARAEEYAAAGLIVRTLAGHRAAEL